MGAAVGTPPRFARPGGAPPLLEPDGLPRAREHARILFRVACGCHGPEEAIAVSDGRRPPGPRSTSAQDEGGRANSCEPVRRVVMVRAAGLQLKLLPAEQIGIQGLALLGRQLLQLLGLRDLMLDCFLGAAQATVVLRTASEN